MIKSQATTSKAIIFLRELYAITVQQTGNNRQQVDSNYTMYELVQNTEKLKTENIINMKCKVPARFILSEFYNSKLCTWRSTRAAYLDVERN